MLREHSGVQPEAMLRDHSGGEALEMEYSVVAMALEMECSVVEAHVAPLEMEYSGVEYSVVAIIKILIKFAYFNLIEFQD